MWGPAQVGYRFLKRPLVALTQGPRSARKHSSMVIWVSKCQPRGKEVIVS